MGEEQQWRRERAQRVAKMEKGVVETKKRSAEIRERSIETRAAKRSERAGFQNTIFSEKMGHSIQV